MCHELSLFRSRDCRRLPRAVCALLVLLLGPGICPGSDDRLCVTDGAQVSEDSYADVTVTATVTFPVEAIQFALCHDRSQLTVLAVFTSSASTQALNSGKGPDFLETVIEDGVVKYYMIVGYPTPTPEALGPGNHRLLDITYDMAPTAQPGTTTLDFCRGELIPSFSDERGFDTLPSTCEATVVVSGGGQPPDPVPFVRGDIDADGRMRIGDMVLVLMHIFAGDKQFMCEKAMDTNDDGDLNIADAVYLGSYIFHDGDIIKAPFPMCGLDETPDSLPCQEYAGCR